MYKRRIRKLEERVDALERKDVKQSANETELYRMAADELKNRGNKSDAVRKVYVYEESRLRHKIVLNAKEKIQLMLKADLKLSLLLLEDGYEDAAVDNIWNAIKCTHRGRQIVANEHLNCKI